VSVDAWDSLCQCNDRAFFYGMILAVRYLAFYIELSRPPSDLSEQAEKGRVRYAA